MLEHWSYDSTMTLAAHLAQSIADAVNLYHFRLSQDYGISDPNEIPTLLDDTTYQLHWIDSAGHPWGGFWVDSGAPLVGKPITDPGRVRDGLRKQRYQQALELGFKLIVHPGAIPEIMKVSTTLENYYVMPDDFQMFLHLVFPPEDSAGVPGEQVREWRRANLDTLTGDFHWVFDVLDTELTDTVLMAGRPDWIGQAIKGDGDWLYDRVYHIWTDENGEDRDPAVADSLAELYDGTKWYSFELALWADEAALADLEIPNNAVIAYTDLYLRDTIGQTGTCLCNMFRFWKRVEVTKAEYLETVALRDSVTNKNPKQAFFDDELSRFYYDLDTLIKFERDTIFNGRTAYDIAASDAGWPGACGVENFCDSLFAARRALSPSDPAYLPAGSILDEGANNANLNWRIYATRVVPVSLMRTRLARHSYRELVAGVYDSLIAADFLAIWEDPRTDSLIDRIGIGDEVTYVNTRAWSALASIVQRAMDNDSLASTRPKQLWTNPPSNFDAFRLFSGDFDSTAFRQAHMVARQRYVINPGDVLPPFYANPDMLGVRARDTVFRLRDPDYIEVTLHPTTGDTILRDTVRARMIVGNHPDDYLYYRKGVQGDYGTISDYNTTVTQSQGPLVPIVARVVDVFQNKYRSRFPNLPSSPVWNVVQTHGHFSTNVAAFDAYGYDAGWGGTRIPTPEEISAQAWLSLNSGANGLVFGDLVYSGAAIGLVSPHFDSVNSFSDIEYGMLRMTNQSWPDTDRRFSVDSMWLGLASRHRGVISVTTEIFHVDTLIGWQNLTRRGQISLHDTQLAFSLIPPITTLALEEAHRTDVDTVAWDHSAGSDSVPMYGFTGTGVFTPRAESYAEITHFTPDQSLEQEWGEGTGFLLITNRLTWPVDLKTYSEATREHFDSLHSWFPFGDSGLGAIDVRRPVAVFANATDVVADSLIVERFDTRQPWIDTVAYGDSVVLPWHLPGEGRLYRMTPLPGGLSQHSTAYNNAVHSENPSTDGEPRDRLVIYERDSVVYLRSVDPDGAWSRELMLSSSADTVLVNGKRTASNFFPSLAVLRDGTSFPRFVWERDSLSYRSVVTAFIAGAGEVSSTTIDSTLQGIDLSVVRHRLSVADSLVGPPALTPSIVQAVTPNAGAGDGFIISWADHQTGVNVAAMRGVPVSYSLIAAADTAVVYNVSSSQFTPQVGQYPTLATAQLFGVVNLTTGTTSGSTFPTDTTFTFPSWITGSTANWRNLLMLHLAWQQGDGVDSHDERIYYARVGVDFVGTEPLPQPSIWVDSNAEHVSKNIAACNFQHPSIAADSVRVGVAFEARDLSTSRKIILRFRDTVGVDPATGRPLKEWETYPYAFGETLRFGRIGKAAGNYVRPSLTHFPMLDSASLELQPDGGMTWFLETSLGGRVYRQRLYRYGWFEPREIDDGAHPSLTLVTLVKDDPFEQASILQRGPNATRVMGENDEGQDVWYYTGHLLNSPGNPLPALFNLGAGTGSIIANATITGPSQWHDCGGYPIFDYYFDVTFTHGGTTHPDDDRHGPGDPTTITTEPGLPPTFFSPPGQGATIIDDLGDATRIVRTGLFIANDQPVTIIRGAAASDSIAEVLDGFPYDITRNCEADIWSVVELVRASDSVVLWRGDTISARGLDTNDIDTVSREVEVPVGTYADSGEIVFIQVRAFTSPEVIYDVGAEFAFQEDPIDGGAPKAARRRDGETGETLLRLSLVPNPVHDGRTTLHVGTELVGRIDVDVWDVNGRRVASLPSINADKAGTYSVELDLEGMRPGSYLVRAYAVEAERSVTVRLTILE